MLEVLAFIAIILMIITEVIIIFKLLSINNPKNIEPFNTKQLKREHSDIAKVDFKNILNGRAYDKYKNKDGLYEPVIGKKGIDLKNKGE